MKNINKKKISNYLLSFILIFFCLYLALPSCLFAEVLDYKQEAENRKYLPIQSNDWVNWPSGPAVSAQSAVLMDAATGAVLYAKNIHEKMYPASTTKILSSLLLAENCSLDEIVDFSKEAVYSVPYDGSNMGMDAGEKITVEQCLYGMLVESANEVSNAAGEHVSGSMSAFAELMNKRARELGCVNSNFVNANGLFDENHYTTALDLALIAREFFQNPLLCQISSTPTYNFYATDTQPDTFTIRSKNHFLNGKKPYEYLVGSKTGFTSQSRQTLVSCAHKNGMKLICVVFKEESPDQFTDTIQLFDYGFNSFTLHSIPMEETRFPNEDALSVISSNPMSQIILPNTASFSDASPSFSTIEQNGSIISQIAYTYNGIPVGTIVTEKTPLDTGINLMPASETEQSLDNLEAEQGQPSSPKSSVQSKLFYFFILTLLVMVTGVFIFVRHCILIKRQRDALMMRSKIRKERLKRLKKLGL